MTTLIVNDTFNTLVGTTNYRIVVEDDSVQSKDYPYIRTILQPSRSDQQDTSSAKQTFKGLYRLDIFGVRSGQSASDLKTIAEELVLLFKPQRIDVIGSQIMINKSWYESTRFDKGIIQVPVFVQWQSWTL